MWFVNLIICMSVTWILSVRREERKLRLVIVFCWCVGDYRFGCVRPRWHSMLFGLHYWQEIFVLLFPITPLRYDDDDNDNDKNLETEQMRSSMFVTHFYYDVAFQYVPLTSETVWRPVEVENIAQPSKITQHRKWHRPGSISLSGHVEAS